MSHRMKIIGLILLVYGCQERPISVRDGADMDPAGGSACNPQSPKSLKCPNLGKHKQSPDYSDGKWGSITLNPLTMKKGAEGQLTMTFTATKQIAQPVELNIEFPEENLVLSSEVELNPDTASDFFTAEPEADTNSKKVTATLGEMAVGAQFTLTFTLTPEEDFTFEARTEEDNYFEDTAGNKPQITVSDGDDDNGDDTVQTRLQTYTDPNGYGHITISPMDIYDDTETDLLVTFTATKAITRSNCKSFGIIYDSRKHFKLHSTNITKKSPASISVDVSRNISTVEICEMAQGDKFTVSFRITPVTNFYFKFGNYPYFRDSNGDLPIIAVTERGQPLPSRPTNTGPVYKARNSDRLRLSISPYPHTLSKSGGVLTLTVTANMNMEKQSYSNAYGQRKYKYEFNLTNSDGGDFSGSDVTKLTLHKTSGSVDVTTVCTSPGNANKCSFKVLEMEKGQSFTLKLHVTSKKSFKLWGFTKLNDSTYTHLSGTPVINITP